MGRYSNYPNGFTDGVTIRGVPLAIAYPGKVFFVNNSAVLAPVDNAVVGADTPSAGTFNSPFSTIDYAVGQTVAGRGDIVRVGAGHAETFTDATGLLLDKNDVAIIGMGSGSSRPTLTFGTDASANIPITANNVSIRNILHINNFADIVSNYTATGTSTPTDFTIEGCEFRDASSILNALSVFTTNATANAADGFHFLNNKVFSLATTAATQTITLAEDIDRMVLDGNYMVHAILNDTPGLIECASKNMTNVQISNNVGFRPNTSSTGGSFVGSPGASCTGVCWGNKFWQLDGSAGIWIATSSDLGFFENYSPVTGAADKSALINPVAV